MALNLLIIADDYFGSNRNVCSAITFIKAIIADDYFGSNRNGAYLDENTHPIIADDYFGSNRNLRQLHVISARL